jgi:hypothetical protein
MFCLDWRRFARSEDPLSIGFPGNSIFVPVVFNLSLPPGSAGKGFSDDSANIKEIWHDSFAFSRLPLPDILSESCH